MAYQDNDDLKRAIDALSVFDVWERAHRAGVVAEPPPPQRRDGQFPSPFREDGKRGSFSVCHAGRGFKDFGGNGDRGGVWKFHALCWPNMEKHERAKELIDWSGITPTVPPPAPAPGEAAAAPGEAAAGATVDPRLARAAKAMEKRDRLRALEDGAYDAREKLLRPAPANRVFPWPDCVRDHWAEGVAHMRAEDRRVRELARERGWPEAWARELVARDLVSYPWERWVRPGEKWAGRQKAFPVQMPRQARALNRITLETVGYHQRFYSPARDGQPENKGWLFVPGIPQSGVVRSDLERGIVEWAAGKLELTPEHVLKDRPKLLPPLPFVLGDVTVPPQLVVCLEGQWDAATFFGACGWFLDDDRVDPLPLQGCWVFGVRGAQGIEALLSYWGEWFARWKPRAWAIADNDAAGGAWRDRPPARPGEARPPTFSDRLVAVGCREPLVSWLGGSWGKDFNDYFKARVKAGKPLGPVQMRAWLQRLGLLDTNNQWK